MLGSTIPFFVLVKTVFILVFLGFILYYFILNDFRDEIRKWAYLSMWILGCIYILANGYNFIDLILFIIAYIFGIMCSVFFEIIFENILGIELE